MFYSIDIQKDWAWQAVKKNLSGQTPYIKYLLYKGKTTEMI
jgi:hypothetical protein